MSSNEPTGAKKPLFVRIYCAVIPATCLILMLAAVAAVVYANRTAGGDVATAESARRYWLPLAALGVAEAVGLVVSLLAVVFLTRSIARPISEMAHEALEMTESDSDGPLKSDGDIRELSELSVAFNRLLGEQRRRRAEIRDLSMNFLHDLKTPLANIRTDAQDALAGTSDTTSALQSICESCDVLRNAIDTNATIAALASGLYRRNMETVNVSDAVSRMVEVYRFVADSRHQVLESSIADPNVVLVAHRLHVQQLVGNLLDNAIKYTPEGGTIRVGLDRGDGCISITVSDSGVGIAESDRKRIFERFFRADPSRHEPGFGLGLPLVKAVVDFYHGEISVDSSPGRGSTFSIRLPIRT